MRVFLASRSPAAKRSRQARSSSAFSGLGKDPPSESRSGNTNVLSMRIIQADSISPTSPSFQFLFYSIPDRARPSAPSGQNPAFAPGQADRLRALSSWMGGKPICVLRLLRRPACSGAKLQFLTGWNTRQFSAKGWERGGWGESAGGRRIPACGGEIRGETAPDVPNFPEGWAL